MLIPFSFRTERRGVFWVERVGRWFCAPSLQLPFRVSESPDCCSVHRLTVELEVRGSPCALSSGSVCVLLSCLGEADLLAVTYLISRLPDQHRHSSEKDLDCILHTVVHIFYFVPSLTGVHAEQRTNAFPSFSASVFL